MAGEEEGERRGGGLSLEETLRAPFPQPFWSPCGARSVPFWGSSSVLGPVAREGAPHHDHGERAGATHNV